MPRYDVFLSHASADKPAVEHLAHKLRKEGLEPFLDKWHLIPGAPWQEALEEALDQSRTCAVLIGKTWGSWQHEEMRSALETRVRDSGFRVITVLLPGGREPGKEELPRFLRRLTWVDFRAGLDDEDAFHRLLAGIRGQAPSLSGQREPSALPYRCMAPAREPFIERSEYNTVRALLVEGSGRVTTVGITTAIHGAGGFGKTALAIELCYDTRVREQYPDGILWTTMSEEIDAAGRLARARDLIRWWTEAEPPAFETISAASAHLRQQLDGKRVLLVLDDVWRPEDVTTFQGLDPRASLLVTTRDSQTLPAESVPVHVDAMEVPEAVRLLGAGLLDGMGVDLQSLAKRLGEWPLLLKIVNRQLRELIQQDGLSLERSLREVNEALDAEGLTVFDREDLESRGHAVARTIGASLRRLSREEVGRFEQLAIFPEDKDIPLPVLEKFWELDSFAAKKICGHLHDLSLLLRFDRLAGTIRLHDVIRTYLLKKGESHLLGWHRCFLDAFRPANGRLPDLPRDETYLWHHLAHHLIGAGQSGVCRELLADLQYLRSKLEATDVHVLLDDYSFFAEEVEELRLVRDALRLSAHVLARNPAELAGQLWGRLLNREESGVLDLFQTSRDEDFGAAWIRPRHASLAGPGGALIKTINHSEEGRPVYYGMLSLLLSLLPDGRVISIEDRTLRIWDVESGQLLRALKVLEGNQFHIWAVTVLDRRRVVFGSSDSTLCVWDVENCQLLHILEEHSDWVLAVAALDSQHVVSGSLDGMLRVWDVESGRTLQILEGHSRPVRAVVALGNGRVVSSSEDGTLRVWDVENGRTLHVLEGHSGWVRTLAVLDSRRVISGSDDMTLQMWDIERGQALQVFKGHSVFITTVAALDSRRVVSASADGELRVWDVDNGQALHALKGHLGGVDAVVVLDSRRVVSSSIFDNTLRVWDLENSHSLQAPEGHTKPVTAVAVLDSQRMVSGSEDGTLKLWDVDSGQALQVIKGHDVTVKFVAILDSRSVVYGSSDGIHVWDLESGQVFREHPPTGVNSLAVLDRRRVVFSDWGAVRVFDVVSKQTLRILTGHSGIAVKAVAVIDRRRVVTGSDDCTLKVWDIENGQALQSLEGHSSMIRTVVALDGHRVVSGSFDGTLRVWDVESGQVLQVLGGHSDPVTAVAVLDSRQVISGSEDRTLRVWDVETGELECLFTLDAPVTTVAVVPDRRISVAGDASGRVHFFDFIEGTAR